MTVFELAAKLSIDTSKFDSALDKAKEKVSNFSGAFGTVSKIGGAASLAAVGAMGGAVVKLTKQSVQAYAKHEQLVGGVETLFGAGAESVEEYAEKVGESVGKVEGDYEKLSSAPKTLIKYANEAYKTAGLSANDYMETATSFAASLVQSLAGDTEKAVEYANMAITDMSDNANKMGTSMESIQYAYQGFAKQNYTINNLMSAA